MAIRTDIYSIDWDVSPRIINIDISVTEANAQDLYDTCKYLEGLPGGMDEDQICDAGGWEPLGGGDYVGITVSLFNAKYKFADRPGPDWVICNMAGGNVVAFTDASKSSTLYPREPSAYVSADRTASTAATTKELEAIQYASYQNGVWYKSDSGYVYGDIDTVGNRQYPVNNIADAITIANEKGFDTIYLLDDININGGSELSGFHLTGRSHVTTDVNIQAAANCPNLSITNCVITGTLDGGTEIRFCSVGTINYVNGHIHDSGLAGTITLAGNNDAVIANCYQIDYNTDPVVDMGGVGQNLVVVEFSGRLNIENMTGSKLGASLSGGAIILNSATVTSGEVEVAGSGYLVDENGAEIETGTWNGGVVVENRLNNPAHNAKHAAEAVWNKELP